MLAIKSLRLHQIQSSRSFSTTLRRAKQLYQSEEYAFNYKGPGYKIYPEKVFYKLLFKKKRHCPVSELLPLGAPSISLVTAAQNLIPRRSVASSKRVNVLNKLFMRYIPEILSTSEVGSKLMSYDVEFSHVKVTSECQFVDVFWIPRGNEQDEIIQKLLNETASPLRLELINLKLMGIIPHIRFLKNKFHATMVEVDRRLQIADFGEDFVPTLLTSDILKGQLQLQTNLPDEIKRKISKLEGEYPVEEEFDIAPLRTDSFGLDREKIMNSIRMSKKKDHCNLLALESEESILGSSAIKEVFFNTEAQHIQTWDRNAFLHFMRREKFKRRKMLKEQSKEFQKQLLEERTKYQDVEEEEDELFVEFVKNAFNDTVDDWNESDRLPQKY